MNQASFTVSTDAAMLNFASKKPLRRPRQGRLTPVTAEAIKEAIERAAKVGILVSPDPSTFASINANV